MPPTIPINSHLSSINRQDGAKAQSNYSMLLCPKACACLKHSNFLKVKVLSPVPYSQAQHRFQQDAKTKLCAHPEGGPVVLDRNPTTSFLTATALIYAIGAGITAAAGTRLALQLILTEKVNICPFQLQNMDALYCYFLSLPPYAKIG